MNNRNSIKGGISQANAQASGLKNHFKTAEGRHKLCSEKTHPSHIHNHGKSVSQVTLASLKEKSASSSSSSSSTNGVRSTAARLLGTSNGGRAFSFAGGNGTSKVAALNSRSASMGSYCNGGSIPFSNFDGKGTYIIVNVGDTLCISDLNSQEKDVVKCIHFMNSYPVCHAFCSAVKGELQGEVSNDHDLLIGLNSGDVYTVSLRRQLQEFAKRLVGAHHYNRDGSVNNSKCKSVAWVPEGNGSFVVAHADGNLFVYEKGKEATTDSYFSPIKDQAQFSVSHAKSSKSNPVTRWHIGQASINSIAFSSDGTHLATVGRDGFLRVFDYQKQHLIWGGKSYYGASLCCSWSMDDKYILTGGEDDLVQVWSMEHRKVIAWGEGHNSWVSSVSFDPYWSPHSSDGTGENMMYRFGSVGQDTRLLLWDFSMEEIVVPLRRCAPGGSPTYKAESQSSLSDNEIGLGSLQLSPSTRDVPKLSPLVAHRAHCQPLSGVVFTQNSLLTVSREGHIKIWARPGSSDNISSNPDDLLGEKREPQFQMTSK